MTSNTALIEKLKAATEPSEELDADIAESLGLMNGLIRFGNKFRIRFEIDHPCPWRYADPYTSSLDAAFGTARTISEQFRMLEAAQRRVVGLPNGPGRFANDPPTPIFDMCRAALLVRLGGE